MASIFGHGFLAYTIKKTIAYKTNRLLVFLAIGSAILPDIDVLAFKFGIAYSHPLGHRGFTHSILFAVLWSVLLSVVFGKSKKLIYFIILFLSTLSHGILDAMTTGGKGVGFFIPFENSRHFFSFRKIQVSPLSIQEFFSNWGIQVILSELIFIGIPCAIVLIALYFSRK